MKRSEIIELMIQASKEYSPRKPVNQHQMNVILETMEKAGMLPPSRWRPMNWRQNNQTYSQWLELPKKIHEWDQE